MLYIDPKDQDIVTTDSLFYRAWTERRKLRLEICEKQQREKTLDAFIDNYLAFDAPARNPAEPLFKLASPTIDVTAMGKPGE